MTQDDIIAAFQRGDLQIDFVEMSLRQNSEINPILYKGKGDIRQEGRTLSFNLNASETINNTFFESFIRLIRNDSGKLFSDGDYYSLEATAIDGSRWFSERILPHLDWDSADKNPIVRGPISRCISGKPVAEASRSIELHYFEEADVPSIRDHFVFDAAGCQFEIEKQEDAFTVRVKSEALLPEYFHIRVEESLRFLLAQSVAWRVRTQAGQIELVSGLPRSHNVKISPPISRPSYSFIEHSWELFDKYLSYVMREPPLLQWNICSAHLHSACEASANSMEAWGIGLCIAVEGLASLVPYQIPVDQKKKVQALQKFVADQVSAHADFKDFVGRVQGVMGRLSSVSTKDRLHRLAEAGLVDKTHVKIWGDLRNKNVHPTGTGAHDVSLIDYQERLDMVQCVTVLMYHIVFHLIGYHGPYSDYGTHGFPTKNYPLITPES